MSRKDDLRRLITEHERRLQKLQEKNARLGVNTPPETLIEMEDIKAELERLQTELVPLEGCDKHAESQSDRSEASDTSEKFPGAMEDSLTSQRPTIVPGPKIHLTVKEETVIRAMFSDYDRVHVEVEFGRGLTDTRVFKVRPIETGGRDPLPVVVKVGPIALIRREWRAYRRWVAGTMPSAARLDDPPTIPDDSSWGGLRYTLAGGDVFKVQSLGDYCRRNDIKEPHQVLEKRLFRLMSDRWWLDVEIDRIQMRAEYDNLLPVNLMIRPLTASLVGDTHKIEPDGQPLPSIAAGDHVHLQGLVITEVEADEQRCQVTLNLPQATEERPRVSYRLRLVDVPDIDRYEEGDVIGSLYGVVTSTRHDLLTDQARQALGTAIDLTSDRISLLHDPTALLPSELPNPLATYRDTLQDFLRVKISTIHGDLNLENVLIDPDIGEVYLIDFAETRKGHALHDLLHLEQGVVTQLIPPVLVEAGLPAHTIWSIYRQLHQTTIQLDQTTPPVLPHPSLEKSFAVLVAIRNAARDSLFNSQDWNEYYEGLILYLLGALKFKNLDQKPETPLPKQVAFWGAATIQALIKAPPPPITPMQRVKIHIQGEPALLLTEHRADIIDTLASLLGITNQEIEKY